MGRGEESKSTSILYNPPRIIKRRTPLKDSQLRIFLDFHLAYPSKEVVCFSEGGAFSLQDVGDERVVIEPVHIREYPLEKGLGNKMKKSGSTIYLGENPFSLTSEGLLVSYSEYEALHFRKRGQLGDDPYIYPLELKKDQFFSAVHAGKEYLTVVVEDKSRDGAKFMFYNRKTKNWEEKKHLDYFSSNFPVYTVNKEEKMMVLYCREYGLDPLKIATISKEGLGDIYSLDEITGSNLSLSLNKEVLFSLITPAKEDGQYFYFDRQRQELRFLDLANPFIKNQLIDQLSNINYPEGLTEKEIKLTSFEDKLLVLMPGKLLFYKKEGLISEIDLNKNYNRVSFRNDRAVLWSIGKRDYSLVALEKHI